MAKVEKTTIVESSTTDSIQEEPTGPAENELKSDATEEKQAPIDPNLVVAVVKKRYKIVMPDGATITHEPGHVTMPREQAEHWYAITNGTAIIGVPDNGDLNGVGAKARIAGIIETLQSKIVDIISFEEQHKGLSDKQKEDLIKSSKFVEGALKLLGSL